MAAAGIQLIGAILTGGASTRFGSDKAAQVGPSVLDAMRAAGVDPIVAVGGDPGALPIPTLADRYPGEGPLGGLATVLRYARTGWVLTVPCDHPLLQAEHLLPLVDGIQGLAPDRALVGEVDGEPKPGLACWPAGWASAVAEQIRKGERRYRSILNVGEWDGVAVDALALEDADDPAQLARLLQRLPPDQHD